jgi:GAF domain-containing protein
VPIRDHTGKIIGVLQALNKYEGIFTPDDEEVLTLLGLQAGTILRNALNLDRSLITHFKLLKLLEVHYFYINQFLVKQSNV